MSAYAHRISVILTHSGAKSQDFRRLNQLGVCMSHGETIKKQKEMARTHDSAVLVWKKEVEFSKKCVLLLQEIKKHQVPVMGEDDMDVDVCLGSVPSNNCQVRALYRTCVLQMPTGNQRRASHHGEHRANR